MPVFTSKTSTDPGPFDALRPAAEGGAERVNLVDRAGELDAATAGQAGLQQNAHLASSATDEDSELEHLYRFQEIPVSAEMRRELLGAKLPLASADQLADTQPPNKSALSAPIGSAVVDRHAPTEPALVVPNPVRETEPLTPERALLDQDSYSTTAPTLLSIRRRRLRNQRLVVAALATLMLAVLLGIAWRRYIRPPESLARDSAADRVKTPRIEGNSPGSPAAAVGPDNPAGDASEAATHPTTVLPVEDEDQDPKGSESANSDSQSAQLSSSATDAKSSSPLSADPQPASRDSHRASASLARAAAPAVQAHAAPGSAAPGSAGPGSAGPDSAGLESAGSAASSLRPGMADSTGKPSSKPAKSTKSKPFDPEELIF